jgi:hypothetical protein
MPPMLPEEPPEPVQAGGDDELQQLLSRIDPEVLARLADLGVLDLATAGLSSEMSQAGEMMAAPMPQGRQVAGTFQASNPLEVAAAAAQRGVGASRAQAVRRRLDDLEARRRRGLYSQYELYGAQPMPQGY